MCLESPVEDTHVNERSHVLTRMLSSPAGIVTSCAYICTCMVIWQKAICLAREEASWEGSRCQVCTLHTPSIWHSACCFIFCEYQSNLTLYSLQTWGHRLVSFGGVYGFISKLGSKFIWSPRVRTSSLPLKMLLNTSTSQILDRILCPSIFLSILAQSLCDMKKLQRSRLDHP